jgi:hypothetical protein
LTPETPDAAVVEEEEADEVAGVAVAVDAAAAVVPRLATIVVR